MRCNDLNLMYTTRLPTIAIVGLFISAEQILGKASRGLLQVEGETIK